MSDLRNGIKSISGNDPTPERIARITSIAHDFDIPKNDAMFPIMVMLDQYHGVFSELPKKVNDAVNNSVKMAERAANLVVNDASKKVQTIVAGSLEPLAAAAFEKGVLNFTNKISTRAAKDAQNKAALKVTQLHIFALVLSALIFGGTGFLIAKSASMVFISRANDLAAEAKTTTEKAAADLAAYQAVADKNTAAEIERIRAASGWAGTPTGRLAKQFFEAGGGLVAVSCKSDTWDIVKTREGRWCVPQRRDLIGGDVQKYGWKIP